MPPKELTAKTGTFLRLENKSWVFLLFIILPGATQKEKSMAALHNINKNPRFKGREFRIYVMDYFLTHRIGTQDAVRKAFNMSHQSIPMTPSSVSNQFYRMTRDGMIRRIDRVQKPFYCGFHTRLHSFEIAEAAHPEAYELFLFLATKYSVRVQTIPRRFGEKIALLYKKINVLIKLRMVERRRPGWVAITSYAESYIKEQKEAALQELLK